LGAALAVLNNLEDSPAIRRLQASSDRGKRPWIQ
jgi:hypothetical protein